ncbi:YbaB/EbfC family nucleoid-associated protein [Saccharopolyspora taberi]|uniref:YbaB/EbfC family DNA-binding protein n=1 Tax=Saccharopolyspora taberi TaxID=60895 RepID=A0ABN3VBB6_9PSEU
MTNPAGRRAELEARNASMRETMTSLLEGISRQTEQLRQAQEQAVATVGKATSEDGLVTVRVNAVGVVTHLEVSSSAFQYTTPKKLSETIVLTIQDAARDARSQADAAFAPVQAEIPDLPDVFPGAPSLTDMIPKAPAVPDLDEDEEDDDYEDDDEEDGYR